MVLSLSAVYAQNKPDEKTVLGLGTDYMYFREVLNGRIRELREINYWAEEKDGRIVKGKPATWKDLDSIGSTRNLIAFFDNKGNLTEYDLIDENNTIRYSNVGVYDNGRCVRWFYLTDDNPMQYNLPAYDERGFMTGGKIYSAVADTLQGSYRITNDEKGNYTRIEYFNNRNGKGRYEILTFNDKGQVIETKFFNKGDTLVNTFKNTYNDKGQLTTQDVIITKPASTIHWDVKCLETDQKGNVITVFNVIENGKFRTVAEGTYVYY